MKRCVWVVALGVLLTACSEGSPGSDPSDLFFPTHGDPALMQALFQGPLVVRDDCVLIGRPGEFSLPIWPEGFTADRDDEDAVVVRDGDGSVVAVEGETFEMSGGYIAEFRPADRVEPKGDQLRRVEQSLGYSIPERCVGSDVYGVWSVGEI